MKPLLIALALCFGMFSNAFSQEIEWQNTIGGGLFDELYFVHQTLDYGYLLSGVSNSNISGDKTENSLGGVDYWVVKTNSKGVIQWQNTIKGYGYDYLKCSQQTLDGGYILGGSSDSYASGDKTENSNGLSDYWVVKISSTGSIVWQNTIGGDYDDELNSIQQTIDGGYILGGYSKSGISGDKTEASHGVLDNDYWIVKIDSIGNIQWQNTVGGVGSDELFSIQQTSDKGYIFGGRSQSFASSDKSENCLGGTDFWIVKTDSLGNIQWDNTIGGSYLDFLRSIQQTSDGGYILGGYSMSNSSGDKTEDCVGDYDYWIVKTDSIGVVQWQNTIGGNDADYLNSVKQTSDGGYILGGASTSNISGDKTENILGTYDFWVVKTDSLGNIQWQNSIGGTHLDDLKSIYQTDDGGYICGGSSESIRSFDKEENCLGYSDYWIVKLTDQYNRITGSIFADFNSNLIQDIGEPPLPGIMIAELNSGRCVFSDQNGKYSLGVIDSGNFLTSPALINLYSTSPATHSAYFSSINQIDSLNDFAFQPQGAFDEVGITILPQRGFRIGFGANYTINYFNVGTTTVSPKIIFYPDNNVVYQSATVAPSQITTDSIVWNLPAITPFQTGSIILSVNVNSNISIGTPINSTVHIEPYTTDLDQSNNNASWEVYAGGPNDPNDILVSDDTLTTSQVNSAPWLDYIVRFQNTGNDTAFTVKILNPIDTNKLNISTIEFVNSSHPVNLNWINYQRNMEFKFDNILLPDSNVNEPLSHGFVHYRIKPKTNLVVGDSIKNFAAIYFDFNEPVITNTAKTVIVTTTGLSSLSSPGKLLVYPNPAQSKININGINLENGKAQLRIFDICGKIILEKIISSANPDIDIQNLPSGMYLLQSGNQRATFVKQ